MTILFLWTLWALADHGLHPSKVVIWVALVLFLYWVWFRLWLNIVGFEPKAEGAGPKSSTAASTAEAESASGAASVAKVKLWPLGYLFLFDRLIPAYQICKEHYSIANFYRRITAHESAAVKPPYPSDWIETSGTSIRPANETERERIERSLLMLRLIGVVLSIFLLAAINSLVSK
jgi:hypothetical protein